VQGRTDDDEQLRAVEGAVNGRFQVGVSGKFLLITEDRKDTLRDPVSAFIHCADQVGGNFTGLDLLVQPSGPLMTGFLIVRVTVTDETPILWVV
jgi:hypothetical protein